jgi:ABC-type branched-subunit amino acid transport system ATPase component
VSLLAIREVSKRFGGITALDECSLEIDRPGIYGLIGPNGAGKTTLFDAIARVTAVDGGRIELFGEDVTGAPSHLLARRGLARSFQECRVLGEFTCLDNLLFAAQPKGLPGALGRVVTRRSGALQSASSEAHRLLALVNLEGYAREPASVLSFGQRRLLEIVATFIVRPRLLLLDEPAAGVNPALLETLARVLRTLFLENPGLLLVVEHNMEFIMSLADDIIVMHQGRVLERGTPEAIQSSAQVAEAYLG